MSWESEVENQYTKQSKFWRQSHFLSSSIKHQFILSSLIRI